MDTCVADRRRGRTIPVRVGDERRRSGGPGRRAQRPGAARHEQSTEVPVKVRSMDPRGRTRASRRAMMGRLPGGHMISVVVPAYNEAALLGATVRDMVDGLRALDLDFELHIVENGSTDGTPTVAARIARRSARGRGALDADRELRRGAAHGTAGVAWRRRRDLRRRLLGPPVHEGGARPARRLRGPHGAGRRGRLEAGARRLRRPQPRPPSRHRGVQRAAPHGLRSHRLGHARDEGAQPGGAAGRGARRVATGRTCSTPSWCCAPSAAATRSPRSRSR